MPIVSSETIYTRPQADGTTRIRIQKTDALGRVFRTTFRSVDAENLARDWVPNLVGADLADLRKHIKSGGTPENFDLTDRDATRDDVRDRAARILIDEGTEEAVRVAQWFAGLSERDKDAITSRLNAEKTALTARATALAGVKSVVEADQPIR